MWVLSELKFLAKVYKNAASTDSVFIDWYNNIHLTSLSHRASRIARSIALAPSFYICFVNEKDNISVIYRKMTASIDLLFSLSLIDDQLYEDLKYELERAMRENSTYCLNSRGYIHVDNSFTSYVKTA